VIDRIVIVNDISAPKGGATALALLSAYEFRARGLAVTFLTGDAGDNEALRDCGVDIVALGQERLLSGSTAQAMLHGLYNREAYAHVRDWISRHDTPGTVYHLHGWAQILSPSVFHALQPVTTRLVLSAHDFFLACPNGSFSFLKTGEVCALTPMSVSCVRADCDRRSYSHKLWRVARQAVQRRFYNRRHSPPVLAIHESMRPFLMRAGIPSAAITSLPNPVTPWSSTRIEAENNHEVLFVGRLESTKGPDLAAAACAAAGFTLRCIGEGVLHDDIAKRYPKVRLEGRLPPEKIAEHARRARVLVMPSRYPEPYGLVAAEAALSGLPVIAPPTAFLTDDLVGAGAGVAVEPRDTAAFAAVLRNLMNDDSRIAAMSHAAIATTGTIALAPNQWIDRLIASYVGRLADAQPRHDCTDT
jgi:glycosyltransferase involved in cell wall biosynthesis